MFKYNIALDEDVDVEQISGFVALYQQSSWLDFVSALKPLVAQFIGRFEGIVELGPVEDKAILQSMVTHESAILQWLELETSDNKEQSLDSVIV